jgi:glycosyltransferase involved in cell wall biosynthesis
MTAGATGPGVSPVRLAVFVDQELQVGGGHQQSLNAALAVRQLSESVCRPVFICHTTANSQVLASLGIDHVQLKLGRLSKLFLYMRRRFTSAPAVRAWRALFGLNRIDRFLRMLGTDLVYFTSPSPLAKDLEVHSYIFTVWDLCHRDHVEFPEVSQDREFERRERLFSSACTKAVAVLVDSPLGARNLSRRYGVDAERVFVEPFSPAVSVAVSPSSGAEINIRERYRIDGDYIFYPAQFWPHKNHAYIVAGLDRLRAKYGQVLTAVFSGSDKGNAAYIQELARGLGLKDRLVFTGFVPNEELPSFYRQSVALVMPTFFGPTNLPPLEAFALDVPVLYAALPGLCDQVGDAALGLNLESPDDLADKLHALLTDPQLRGTLVARGRRRLEEIAEGRGRALPAILSSYRAKRASWGPMDGSQNLGG